VPWASVTWLFPWLVLLLAGPARAVDEPAFRVLESAPPVEIRAYAAYAVAETRVSGAFADVGNEGSRRLFACISGDNAGAAQLAMTAPLTQQAVPDKITKTAPVLQQPDAGGYPIAFVLPERYTAAGARPLQVSSTSSRSRYSATRRSTGRYSP
jgi:hypothetical protein